MAEVILHVYDVTNNVNVHANSAILGLNRFMRGGVGIGGIFHGAVEVYNKEWSFGFCESGSGVFSCEPKRNPMYTYRESQPLGRTNLIPLRVEAVLQELSREWPGHSYDLLSRNCNHFCDSFCLRLGVQKLPLWVNRFANAGDAAFEAVDNTMARLKQAKEEVLSASRNVMQFMFGSPTSSSAPTLDTGGDTTNITSSPGGSPTQLSFQSSPSSPQDGGSRDGSDISPSDSDDDDGKPPTSDTLP